MKNFTGKYERIIQEAIGRYQTNGFLGGDYVKINKSALSGEFGKSLSAQMKAMIEAVIKSNSNLRISVIKADHSDPLGSPIGSANQPGKLYADVVVEYAPGMWKDPMTLPVEVLEKVEVDSEGSTGDTGMSGFAQYSASILRPDHTQIKPTELKATDNRSETPDDDHNLTTKNHKLANTKKPKDGLKQVNASVEYGSNDAHMIAEAYLASEEPQVAEKVEKIGSEWTKDVDSLAEAYQQISKKS